MGIDLPTWTPTAGGNIRALPDGWPENMPRSSVNDQARETMASVKRWYNDPEWLELTRTVAGDEIVPMKFSANVLRVAGDIDFSSSFPVGFPDPRTNPSRWSAGSSKSTSSTTARCVPSPAWPRPPHS